MNDRKTDAGSTERPTNQFNPSGRHRGRRLRACVTYEFIMALCALGLVFVALWQLWLMKDTACKQLRAYVAAVKGEVKGIDGSAPFQVRITIRNSGQTPAYETSVEEFYVWWQEAEPLVGAMPIKKGIQTTLASGEEIALEHKLEASGRQGLLEKRLILHANGKVCYKDIYGTPHESSFHFVQGHPYNPRSPYMGLADNGNRSD